MAGGGTFGSLVGRALAGVFAGAVFGMMAAALFRWEDPAAYALLGVWAPLAAPLLGALIVAVIAVWVGGRTLPDWVSRCTAGALIGGVVVGPLLGACVAAPLLMSSKSPFYGKVQVGCTIAGVIYGLLLGGVAALLVSVVIWFVRRGAAMNQTSKVRP